MKSIIKLLKILLIIFAFSFSTNVDATTTTKWGGHKKHVKKKLKKIKKRNRKGKKSHKVPVDGGLGILMLGAAAFGATKLRKKN